MKATVIAILDKVRTLLTSEPARLIGYGAAVIVTLVAQFLAGQGYVHFAGVSFESALVLTLTAITFVVTVVESIRKFVFSPQTYIEDLSDTLIQGHVEAHEEEAANQFIQSMLERAEQRRTTTVNVGTAKADGTGDLVN